MNDENFRKLKIPAIGLIITAILNILFGLYFLFSAYVVLNTNLVYQNFRNDQEKLFFNIGLYGIIGLGILSLLVAPVIIFGALKLRRGENAGFAKASPILAMIPITSFMFPLGILFGIWALAAMRKTKVEPARSEVEPPSLNEPPEDV